LRNRSRRQRTTRIRLNKNQSIPPAALEQRQTDPEQPVLLSQQGLFPLPLERRQLPSQSWILDSDGLMTAVKQSNKPKHTQNDDGHATFILAENESAVNGCVFGDAYRKACGST
jgi:hypothetical protein